MLQKQSEAFHTFLWHFFPSLRKNFIGYHSSKVSSHPDCIFEIHQLWQSGFSRMYSNSSCSCSFEPEIIKIGQSSHYMYSNNILNFQESMTIFNAHTKKSRNLSYVPRIYIYIYICSLQELFRTLADSDGWWEREREREKEKERERERERERVKEIYTLSRSCWEWYIYKITINRLMFIYIFGT